MIINTKNNNVLAKEIKLANNVWKRLIGLMGKRELIEGEALFIYPCQQIHTFFMRFPIDCLFIDYNYQVIEVLENVQVWKASKKVPNALGVIELSVGTIEKTNTEVNDLIVFDELRR